jgi:hypothetical protein
MEAPLGSQRPKITPATARLFGPKVAASADHRKLRHRSAPPARPARSTNPHSPAHAARGFLHVRISYASTRNPSTERSSRAEFDCPDSGLSFRVRGCLRKAVWPGSGLRCVTAQSRRGKWSKLGDGTAFVGMVIIVAAETDLFGWRKRSRLNPLDFLNHLSSNSRPRAVAASSCEEGDYEAKSDLAAPIAPAPTASNVMAA